MAELLRHEGPRVLATLARYTGSLTLAEDAVQDATVRALEKWGRDGVPINPRAWLMLTAKRRAVDIVRRETVRGQKEPAAVAMMTDADLVEGRSLSDDILRLIFTCCHPSIEPASQMVLALRWLCGLSTDEVARALLLSEAATSKRLSRARNKIAVAHIPYQVPPAHELPGRLSVVLRVIYLLFNEGYASARDAPALRPALTAEALRLAQLLRELFPDDAGVAGLLALVLLHESRAQARLDSTGDLVLLADQDRSLWSQDLMAQGIELVAEGIALAPAVPNVYVVQAAISACHAIAPTWEATDWPAILSWYDVLLTLEPTPVVVLNRAVAVAEVSGPEMALAQLASLDLPHYPLLPATRAELLAKLGRLKEAREELRLALRLPANDAQRRLLTRRLAGLPGAD